MREANVSVSDSEYEAMGIEELVALGREAGLVDLEEFSCTGAGGVVQAEVESRFDEDALDDLAYVNQWELVTESEDSYLYLVDFVAPDLPDEITEHADDLVGTCDPDLDEHGATMSFVGPQDTIRDVINEYVNSGVSPELRSLEDYDGRDRPMDGLTDRQREVMETAYDAGYYDVPREVSTEDVAAELDVDPSTVAEHLQRAERNLLSQNLSATH